MAYHYSTDGKDAYQIKAEHPECPVIIPSGARCMTSARIDFEGVQDMIIEWYENRGKNCIMDAGGSVTISDKSIK